MQKTILARGQRGLAAAQVLSSHTAVVTLTGEHDLATRPTVTRALAETSAYPNLIVDISACAFLCSTTLEALLGPRGTDSSAGDQTELVAPLSNRPVRRILDLLGVPEMLAVHESLADAARPAGESSTHFQALPASHLWLG